MVDLDKFECRWGNCTEEECCIKILDVVTTSGSNSEYESCKCTCGVAIRLSYFMVYCEDFADIAHIKNMLVGRILSRCACCSTFECL